MGLAAGDRATGQRCEYKALQACHWCGCFQLIEDQTVPCRPYLHCKLAAMSAECAGPRAPGRLPGQDCAGGASSRRRPAGTACGTQHGSSGTGQGQQRTCWPLLHCSRHCCTLVVVAPSAVGGGATLGGRHQLAQQPPAMVGRWWWWCRVQWAE
jgi:hypothetical protein